MANGPTSNAKSAGQMEKQPSRPASQKVTLKQIWRDLKDYFGDGYIEGSSPLRFRVHLCETEKPAPTDNNFFGVHIDEDYMPLFETLGVATKPPCTCQGMAAVISHIDAFVESSEIETSTSPSAYSIYSRKNDTVAEDTCIYAMRDVLQWWVHWHGPLDRKNNHWKHIYVGFSTIPDDLLIPPEHLADGTFRFLGHTVHEMLTGMRAEGVSAADCEYMYMCLLREYVVQYLEKVHNGLRELLLEKTLVMSQFRSVSANTPGCAVVLLAARGIAFLGSEDEKGLDVVAEMSSYSDALSMDMTKETLGVLQGEPTETVAGRNRMLLNAELRWTYARCMAILDAQDGGKYLRRFASSGFHFVPIMDRYQERLLLQRRKVTPQMQEMMASYSVGSSIPSIY